MWFVLMLLWYRNRKRDRYYSCFLARDRAADSRFLIMRLFLLSAAGGWAEVLLEGGGCWEEGWDWKWKWGREKPVSEEAEESMMFGESMVVKSWNTFMSFHTSSMEAKKEGGHSTCVLTLCFLACLIFSSPLCTLCEWSYRTLHTWHARDSQLNPKLTLLPSSLNYTLIFFYF